METVDDDPSNGAEQWLLGRSATSPATAIVEPMTTDADLTASNKSAASSRSLIDPVPHESPETGWDAGSQSSAAPSAGALHTESPSAQTLRGCRVAEPVTELHAWLSDIPDHTLLLIYRAFLDCLNPR